MLPVGFQGSLEAQQVWFAVVQVSLEAHRFSPVEPQVSPAVSQV